MKNKPERFDISTVEMEIALIGHFNVRQNLIVPNISWGLYLQEKIFHECDLLVLTGSNYLYEVEIKISKADLIADVFKKHHHLHPAIKRLYFAIPAFLKDDIEHIPERAGIILVHKRKDHIFCRLERKPKDQKGYKLKEEEKLKIALLGSMRIWSLKKKIIKLNKMIKEKT